MISRAAIISTVMLAPSARPISLLAYEAHFLCKNGRPKHLYFRDLGICKSALSAVVLELLFMFFKILQDALEKMLMDLSGFPSPHWVLDTQEDPRTL